MYILAINTPNELDNNKGLERKESIILAKGP